MGNSTSQLALGILLRFTDQGSSAATKAIDGVQKALDSVTRGGAKTSGSAAKVEQSMRGMGGAAEVAGRGLDGLGSASAVAARGAEQVTRQADAAKGSLDKMAQAADRAAKAGKTVTPGTGAGGGPPRGENGRFLPQGGIAGNGGMAAITGAMAAKMVLAGPVRETMSYERQLAHLANTGAPGSSLAERQALMKTMDAGIMGAVQAGGGSREGAMGTLDRMVASGAYKSPQDALKDLPALIKAGTASGADPGELADVVIKARQTMGITDMDSVLNKAMKAGQLGGFEIKDMAKWLPAQMAAAKAAGLSGESGLTAILAANQASVVTAGSKDEAGNNLVNLLGKINSEDTANNAKKLGIDLTGALAAARAKGTNGLDAFVNLTEQTVGKDARFQELQKKAKNATGDEQKAMYADMANIIAGSSIGKIIVDRQAQMALIGVMQQRLAQGDASTGSMRGSIDTAKAEKTVPKAHELIASTADYKREQLAAAKANAMQNAMDQVNPLLGGMADILSGIAKDYPVLAAATWGATAALTALSAAAGAASLANLLTGGAGAGGVAGQVLSGASRLLTPAAGAAAFGVGYGAGSLIYDHAIAGTSGGDRLGEFLVSIAGFLGNQEAKNALLINRQNDAAQAMKDAADELKRVRPAVYVDPQQLDREMQQYQSFEARRR